MSDHVRSAADYASVSLRDLVTLYFDLVAVGLRDREGGPVPAGRMLDRLALGEAISRHVRDGRQVDILAALSAGADWKAVGDVLDVPVAQLREEFRRWVDGQRSLYEALRGERPGAVSIGLSPTHARAVLCMDTEAANRSRSDYGRS